LGTGRLFTDFRVQLNERSFKIIWGVRMFAYLISQGGKVSVAVEASMVVR